MIRNVKALEAELILEDPLLMVESIGQAVTSEDNGYYASRHQYTPPKNVHLHAQTQINQPQHRDEAVAMAQPYASGNYNGNPLQFMQHDKAQEGNKPEVVRDVESRVEPVEEEVSSFCTDLVEVLHDESVAKTQVKTQAKACTSCRSKHVKCDKLLPCSRCRRLGIECIPQAKVHKRLPKGEFKADDWMIVNGERQSADANTVSITPTSVCKRQRGIDKSTKDLLRDYYSVRALNVFETGIKLGLPFNRCAMKIMFDASFSHEMDKLHEIFRNKPTSMVESLPIAVATYTYPDESEWWNTNFCRLIKGGGRVDLFGDVLPGSDNEEYRRMKSLLKNAKLDFLSLMYIFSFCDSAEQFQASNRQQTYWNQRIVLPDGETRILRIGKKPDIDPYNGTTTATFQFQDVTDFYPSWRWALTSLRDFKNELEPNCG